MFLPMKCRFLQDLEAPQPPKGGIEIERFEIQDLGFEI